MCFLWSFYLFYLGVLMKIYQDCLTSNTFTSDCQFLLQCVVLKFTVFGRKSVLLIKSQFSVAETYTYPLHMFYYSFVYHSFYCIACNIKNVNFILILYHQHYFVKYLLFHGDRHSSFDHSLFTTSYIASHGFLI